MSRTGGLCPNTRRPAHHAYPPIPPWLWPRAGARHLPPDVDKIAPWRALPGTAGQGLRSFSHEEFAL
ncbi:MULTISPECIES: hypothetical protein [unclassified Frankia]|uniref:hypothetical protein n=1 Tax=unclassified Frankia TaxID=2632575 RepID=UPI0020241600